ncbi:MAG: C39 family peptidase [Anaerolineae bacterium]|nr:C39 family peptidase [Anaerolineae bacterium]
MSRNGALIFGLGLGALFATLAIALALAMPLLSTRLENAPMYARTYYRKMFPPPQYLPTPAPTVSFEIAAPQSEPEPAEEAASLASLEETAATTNPDVVLASINVTKPGIDDQTGEVQLISPTTEVTLNPTSQARQLTGLNHQWQTWNNCGPATITTYMSYYGRTETQVDSALYLKPNKDDKNVSPYQLAAYAQSVGMEAILRQGGSVEQLKQFISNGLPVLVETWLIHDGDGLGHYRLITGYNDDAGQFITSDSLSGPQYPVSYDQFDPDWRVFNRLYIVVFPPEQADLVAGIIGPDLQDQVMYEKLMAAANAELEANPTDQIAYFNKGEALTRLERYQEAAAAFDAARKIGLHWRRLWYQFTPFEAYYAVGRYQDVLDLAEATIANSGGLEEAYYYKGLALHTLGQPGAEEALQAALDYNPNFSAAQVAMETLHGSVAGP